MQKSRFFVPAITLTIIGVLAVGYYFATRAVPTSPAPMAQEESDLPAVATQNARVRIDIPAYDPKGRLLKPEGLLDWVFMGTSLGMGYSQMAFDEDDPGMFQVVLMEPQGFRFFQQNGYFANGTMFGLLFYGSAHRVSINRSGFVLGGEMGVQVHVIDKERFADGHAFFNLGPYEQAGASAPLPPGNGCVSCHKTNGAHDGVFAQFYPRLKPLIPKAELAAAMARGREIPPLVESH